VVDIENPSDRCAVLAEPSGNTAAAAGRPRSRRVPARRGESFGDDGLVPFVRCHSCPRSSLLARDGAAVEVTANVRLSHWYLLVFNDMRNKRSVFG
jgi:hypothetical protein